MLSENGMNDIAYHLLMEEGYPGWLYEVLMGATTVWERWNSVEPDGKISGTEMNSLNHYSYGSIVEWMFRNMAGINPTEETAGFKKFRIVPMPDYRIENCDAKLRAASGLIESAWKIDGKQLKFKFTVPFDAEAEIVLPNASAEVIAGQAENIECRQDGENVVFLAEAGTYEFCYEPTTPYRKTYSINSTWEELQANPKTKAVLEKEYPLKKIPFEKELCTLEEMTWGPFTGYGMTREKRERIDKLLKEVE